MAELRAFFNLPLLTRRHGYKKTKQNMIFTEKTERKLVKLTVFLFSSFKTIEFVIEWNMLCREVKLEIYFKGRETGFSQHCTGHRGEENLRLPPTLTFPNPKGLNTRNAEAC